jgi:hypothetical protein
MQIEETYNEEPALSIHPKKISDALMPARHNPINPLILSWVNLLSGGGGGWSLQLCGEVEYADII